MSHERKLQMAADSLRSHIKLLLCINVKDTLCSSGSRDPILPSRIITNYFISAVVPQVSDNECSDLKTTYTKKPG